MVSGNIEFEELYISFRLDFSWFDFHLEPGRLLIGYYSDTVYLFTITDFF